MYRPNISHKKNGRSFFTTQKLPSHIFGLAKITKFLVGIYYEIGVSRFLLPFSLVCFPLRSSLLWWQESTILFLSRLFSLLGPLADASFPGLRLTVRSLRHSTDLLMQNSSLSQHNGKEGKINGEKGFLLTKHVSFFFPFLSYLCRDNRRTFCVDRASKSGQPFLPPLSFVIEMSNDLSAVHIFLIFLWKGKPWKHVTNAVICFKSSLAELMKTKLILDTIKSSPRSKALSTYGQEN